MPSDWMKARPGRYVRFTEDGKAEIKMVGSVARTVERNARIRREVMRNPEGTDSGGDLGHLVASYPQDVEQEIQEKCGNDPDNKLRYLRDNPHWLVRPKSHCKLPPKRIYIFPQSMRSGK